MEFSLHFVYPWAFFVALFIVILAFFIRLYVRKPVYYIYSLGSVLKAEGKETKHAYHTILLATRAIIFLILSFLLAKPQLVDYQQPTIVDGIDIMLVLDISASMQLPVDQNDMTSRIEVAKKEALRFIKKRKQDNMGIVFFAADAISRCPLTLDKTMLTQIIEQIEIGNLLNPDGTFLATGIITASNRLKKSKAKSKIMIVLTDGEPTPGDADWAVALEIAKQLGIKIYTIGIGSEGPIVLRPFLQVIPGVNKDLLQKIARETKGQYFFARNASDMRLIYDTIDRLEKTEHDLPIFHRYYDIFVPFVIVILSLLLWELLACAFWWFNL